MLRRLLLCVAIASCVANSALALTPKVVVREVEVFNAPQLVPMAPGLRSMLASRLDGDGYQVTTAGDAGPHDWTVDVTITHLGSVYSIDAALVPSDVKLSGERSYQTTKNPDDLPGALQKVAQVLKDHLTRVLPAGSSRTGMPPPPKMPRTPPVEAPAAPPARVAELSTEAMVSKTLKYPRKGSSSPGEARSLCVADVDGDGHDEILVLLDDEILGFRDDGADLRQIWSAPTPSSFKVATISTGDVDGDGTPEVFVAGMNGTHPQSQAYLWFGSALSPRGRRIPAFVKAVTDRAGKRVLVGRSGGLDLELFASVVRTYVWNGSQYEKNDPLELPDNVDALNFDFVKLDPEAAAYTVHTVGGDHLQVVDGSGEVVYTGDEAVKGSRTLLVGEEKTPGYADADVARAQGKSVGWVSPRGESFLFLPRNAGSSARLFTRVNAFGQGQIIAYRFDGLTLVPEAEGPSLPGFLPDVALSSPPSGLAHPVLYTILVKGVGGLISKPSTLLLAYDLP